MNRVTRIMLLTVFVLGAAIGSAKEDRSLYYDDGKVRETKKFYTSGSVREIDYFREDGTLSEKETYDRSGNKLSESNYSSKGRLVENSDGWAAIKWSYDGGNLSSETYYNSNGRVTERKVFNDEGDLVGKQYVGGGKLDPAEEFNPWPTVAGEEVSYFDKYGRPEGTTEAESW
ncbi:MAG: hypothetical protein GF408_07335 [Candidatus Omnitrophica bacterium]|nr:hypothetical protein [Candidatus Omnitrophota bacterium]